MIEDNLNFPDRNHYYQLAKSYLTQGQLTEAIAICQTCIEVQPNFADIYQIWGEILQLQGNFTEAIACYQKALSLEPDSALSHWQLGDVLNQISQPNEAWHHKQQALALQPNLVSAEVHNKLGLNLASQGKVLEAIAWFQRAISVQPEYIEAHYNLGIAWAEHEDIDKAIACFQTAISLNPEYLNAQLNLGALLIRQNQTSDAIAVYQSVLRISTDCLEAHINLGFLYTKVNNFASALQSFQQALSLDPNSGKAYSGYGTVLAKQNQLELAIDYLQKSLLLQPDNSETMFILGMVLMEQNRTKEGVSYLKQAYAIDSFNLKAYRMAELALPILYANTTEISQWRQSFTQGLHKYQQKIAELDLSLSQHRHLAFDSINCSTNFYLGYQAQNDLNLQIQYGEIVHRIMSSLYPKWIQPLNLPLISEGGKIRIGYISAQLRSHSGTKWLMGWLKYRDRQQFEVYSYLTDFPLDQITESFAQESDYFYHIPNDINAIATQIRNDNLHVLVYPDIGMHPLNTQLAALRLAPVQCVGWGHPITTGLSTVDYFLSSECMEPNNAQSHYTEQLVLLPKLGVSYPFPKFTKLSASNKIAAKQKFGFRADALVFLSCQALYKYLPQYDFVFAAIAQRLPNCQFAFLAHPNSEIVNALFWQRLHNAFAEYGLDRDDYCVLLPRGNQVDYLISDIFLDTFTWSGGNTSLEVIACDLPIVTMPGEFMRGRHAHAMLQVLGVTDTVAWSTDEYIDIAVRLAVDRTWRDSVVAKMHQNHHLLFDDSVCVRALEDFFRSVVLD